MVGILAIPILLYARSAGPPSGVTGGFGEGNCTSCHDDFPVNSGSGSVSIAVPLSYSSGTTYPITVTVADPNQMRWGFELSARTQTGQQAGTLIAGSDGFTQRLANLGAIQYIGHTSAGTRIGTPGSASFAFTWQAPDVSAGPVVFHAAGNAANGDLDDGGDRIYITSATSQPQAILLPTIAMSSPFLSFTATQGGASPASQPVTISNSGGGILNWTATASTSSGGNWLSVSPTAGSGTGTVTVAANIAGLAAATYIGSIQVAAVGATNTPQTISVTLTIISPSSPPMIALSTSFLPFTALPGGANPATQAVTISNFGSGTLNWTAITITASGGDCLSVSPMAGTGTGTVTVSANIAGLATGTYNGSIQVAAVGATNTPQTISVTLTITSTPSTIALSVPSLTFTAQQAGANPALQELTISNAGGGTLNWTANASTFSGGDWLSVFPAAGTGTGTMTVSVNSAGLAAAIYHGSIQIAASGTTNGLQTVPVTLAITPPAFITLNVSSLTFDAQQGGANPAAQTVTISNSGGLLSWVATADTSSGGNWLSVSPAGGAGTGPLTVSVNSASLAAGIYNGSIQVVVLGISSPPQTIAVSLILTSPGRPEIALKPASFLFVTRLGSSPSPQTIEVQNMGTGGLGWTTSVTTQSGGDWLSVSPVTGVAPSALAVSVNAAELPAGAYTGTITIAALPSVNASNSPQTVPVTLAVGPPVIAQGGVVNAASFSRDVAVSPGSIASLSGQYLATTTLKASSLPLPTEMGGVTVRINDIAVPLFFVSPERINFQVPWELVGQLRAFVTVSIADLSSLPVVLNLSAFAPGIFSTNSQGNGQGVILISSTGEVAAPLGSIPGRASRPVNRGEFLTIYCTGLGDVTNRPANGDAALGDPLSTTLSTPTVTIGGIAAPVSFSGLSPGFVGLYQVNVPLPENAPTGDAIPVVLSIGGVISNTVTIAVQ